MIIVEKVMLILVGLIIITSVVIPVTESVHGSDAIDIILIDGQSNGAYDNTRTDRIDLDVVNDNLGEPSHKAYYYGTETSTSRAIASNTMVREMYRDGEWKIGGMEAGIAYYLMEKNNRDVLVLNIAINAIGIKDLAVGAYWEQGKAMIKAAISSISPMYDSKNYVGWVMIHGEADRNNTVSYYEQYFNILDDNLDSLGFRQCYIALPRYVWGLNAYDAMLDLAKKNPDVHIATDITETFTTTNGLLCNDNLHYTQLGRLVLSEAVIDAIPADPSYDSDIVNIIQIIPIILITGVILLAARMVYQKTR